MPKIAAYMVTWTTYGDLLERYEYDAYGSPYILEPNFAADPDGKSDYGNPYLFTGRRVDFLDNGSLTLQYNRHRYYDYYTGRWTTHDPMGYVDGMNLYEYGQASPVRIADPFGLTSRADIEGERLVYSCNCGWIDWSHADEGIAGYWDAIDSSTGPNSLSRNGFGVGTSMTHHGGPFTSGIYWSVFVENDLTDSEKESVALGIFKELAWKFESLQSRWYYRSFSASGFSEEDPPSDLLGFYMKVKGFTQPQIEARCRVLDIPCSLQVWDETRGLKRYKPAWVSNHWVPKYHHTDSETAGCCCGSGTWPADFATIVPAEKGNGWDDWRRAIDYSPWGMAWGPPSPWM